MHTNGGFEADIFDNGFSSSKPSMHTTQIDAGFQNFHYNDTKVNDRHFGSANHEEEEEEDEGEEANKGQVKRCLKRFASLMVSHLGTFVIVCSYVMMGGFLFSYLEVDNEISSCKIKYDKYVSKRNEAVDRMYNVAQSSNATLAKRGILEELNTFAEDVSTLGVDPTLDCSTLGQAHNMASWNFVNAAYFCVTIVTTIGYGHISPGTMWGQIVCMIYSILGIPLMLLFLTKIGEPTAMVFRSFYLNIFCCKCFVKKLPHEKQMFEDMKNGGQQTTWEQVEAGGKQPPAKVGELTVVEEEYDDEDFGDEEEDVVNIPITVTIMLLVTYIVLGAAVFRIWEKEWDIVEGTYFSFITLSTIGFGDYVPGRDGPFDQPEVIVELIVGAIYCLFGLAMLSMCINLIQDEIQAKFQWLGRKIGVIKQTPLSELESDDSSDDESDSDDDEDEEEEEKERQGGSKSKSAISAKTTSSSRTTDNNEENSFA